MRESEFRTKVRRVVAALDASAESLALHEVRVLLFAALATASWLALGALSRRFRSFKFFRHNFRAPRAFFRDLSTF